MPQLKGRLISKEEAREDINRYLQIRDDVYEKINKMLENDPNPSISSNEPLKQYFKDNENSFFFNIEMLQKLIDKAKQLGGNCIRIYYGAATKPTNPESLRLYTQMGVQEGSSTLVLVPCFAEIDSTNGEIKKVKNVVANDGEDGGQWPGGSFIEIGGRVGSDLVDETAESNISIIPGSVFL
jgi:hypothetical protein